MPRQSKKYHYIYKTTCIVNGKFYIGMHSTDNLEDGYMGSGKRIWYSLKKYGRENHEKEILEFLPDRRSLAKREEDIVNEMFIKDNNCMNIKVGGQGGFTKEQSSKGAKTMLSKVWNDEEYIKRKKEFALANMLKLHQEGKVNKGYDWTGRKHKQETKDKIGFANSIKQLGRKNSQFGTVWLTKNGKNIKVRKEDTEIYILEEWIKGRT